MTKCISIAIVTAETGSALHIRTYHEQAVNGIFVIVIAVTGIVARVIVLVCTAHTAALPTMQRLAAAAAAGAVAKQ